MGKEQDAAATATEEPVAAGKEPVAAAEAPVAATEAPVAATKDVEMKQVPGEADKLPEASPEKKKPELTPEQLKRIEENRQKALAKKLAAQANQSPSPQKGTTPNVTEATP